MDEEDYGDIKIGEPLPSSYYGIHTDRRILYPGSVYTLDHKPDRLNVCLDWDGRVNKIWFG